MKILLILTIIFAAYYCQEECPQGQYFFQPWGTCQPCFANCMECNGPHTCITCRGVNRVKSTCSCKAGYVSDENGDCYDPNAPVPEETTSTQEPTSSEETSEECDDDEFWDETNGICQQCFENCISCDNYSTCNECVGENRHLENCSCFSGFISDEDGNCYNPNSDGQECGAAQYYSTHYSSCQPCFANCIECSGPHTCTKCDGPHRVIQTCSCKPGYVEVQGQCQLNNQQVQLNIFNSQNCEIGQFWDGTMCQECGPNCAYCTATTCLSCLGARRAVPSCECTNGYRENKKKKCVLIKPRPGPNNNGICPDGFFNKRNRCVPCYRGCTKCTSKLQCLECVDPYLRFLNSCFCRFGYYDVEGTCRLPECDDGYYPVPTKNNGYKCLACGYGCLKCTEYACQQCRPNSGGDKCECYFGYTDNGEGLCVKDED